MIATMFVVGILIAFIAGAIVGHWWGQRRMKRFFAGISLDRSSEIISLTAPAIPRRIRHINSLFLGWSKATERLEVAKRNAASDVRLDRRSLTLQTGMLLAATKKLASELDEAMKTPDWPSLPADEK